jgi:hypothetical protein
MYTKEDIQGNHEVDIKAGSSLPLNRRNRMTLATEILKLGPSIGVGPNSKVAKVCGKTIFRDMEMYAVEEAFDEDIKDIEAQQQANSMMAQATAQGIKQGIVPQVPTQRGVR